MGFMHEFHVAESKTRGRLDEDSVKVKLFWKPEKELFQIILSHCFEGDTGPRWSLLFLCIRTRETINVSTVTIRLLRQFSKCRIQVNLPLKWNMIKLLQRKTCLNTGFSFSVCSLILFKYIDLWTTALSKDAKIKVARYTVTDVTDTFVVIGIDVKCWKYITEMFLARKEGSW